MTLTRDRTRELACRDARCSPAWTPRGLERIADRASRGRRSPADTSSPARARSGPGSSSSRAARVRVVRDGDGRRRASARATSSASCPSSTAGRAIAQVIADGPTACLALASWDFEAVVRERARGRARHPARPGRPAARRDAKGTGTEPRPVDDARR